MELVREDFLEEAEVSLWCPEALTQAGLLEMVGLRPASREGLPPAPLVHPIKS